MRYLAWLFVLLLLLAAGMAGAGWWYLERFMAAPSSAQSETIVLLEPGSGLARIAADLTRAGVVDDALLFRFGARVEGRDRALKAGEYAFPAAATPREVLDILEEGKSIQHRLVVPEGLTVQEVAALVEADPVLEGPMPALPSEGTLLPETWFFVRGETRADLIGRMQASMVRALDEAWAERAPDLPLADKGEVLTLASIIEKETAVADEYGLVAGVFVNRLRRGMPLQTDPTVIYALTGGSGALGRALLRKDLEIDSPYNTYRITGLPPGPIANPGKAAIRAAVAPADTDFLYFVADGTGGHAFAETLAEHNRNVAKWRKIKKDG